MSLIACLSSCVYQQDGYCSLERAASAGTPGELESCVNFVPKSLQKRSQSLSNIINAN